MVRVAVLLSPGATAPAGRHPTGLAGHLGEGRGPGRIGHAVGLVTFRPFEEPLERPGGIVEQCSLGASSRAHWADLVRRFSVYEAPMCSKVNCAHWRYRSPVTLPKLAD